ncbi:MAG TPA: FtsX-like permease family protein [Lacipirellulaceae bacterium]|nr:FtsX-like permease family protein [Lacipirellulaceae bacterium]
MSFWKIAWRNISERSLASSLTGLSMALGVALLVLVLVIHSVVVGQLSNDAQGYNFIVGPREASPLEIVLSSVFHIGRAPVPMRYRYYKQFIDGPYAPYADLVVPICLGDSFAAPNGQRFRVVGTTPDLFGKLSYGADDQGNDKLYKFRAGRNFKQENFFEAVLGSVAANRTGLRVGDHFRPSHGLKAGGDEHDEFEVVGILAPTGTANDRALFVNMEGFYLLDGHALAPPPGEAEAPAATADGRPTPLPESRRSVTAFFVLCQPTAGAFIDIGLNRGDDRGAKAVAPSFVVTELKENFIDPVRFILLALTVLIVIVAGISILVSIYNSMSERSHDIAVMRALGASRGAVMRIILVEAVLLSILGGAAGLLLGHGILAAASPIVEFYSGITVPAWHVTWQELLLVPGLVAFAILVGLLPALTAYRTDVAKTLGGAR